MTPDAYLRLVELGREEAELAQVGDLEALGRVHEERGALIAHLPSQPPAEAAGALLEAARLQATAAQALERARQQTTGELARLGQGRRTARSYTPAVQAVRALDQTG